MTSGRLYCFHKTQSEFALQRTFPESFVSSSVRRKTLGTRLRVFRFFKRAQKDSGDEIGFEHKVKADPLSIKLWPRETRQSNEVRVRSCVCKTMFVGLL